MYILSDIFQIYVNQTMTCKILNIDAEIFNTLKQEILLKCYQIQVPSILECSINIKKQFYLVIYPLDIELNRISIYLCKKKYDFSQEFFLPKKGLCKKNFVLDFTIDEPENKNWKEIQDNKILFDDINLTYLEEHNIKLEEYANYISLYHDEKDTEFEVKNIWGETVSILNLDWVITMENIIKKDYGIPNNHNLIPPYHSFIKSSINQVYYPEFDEDCNLYKFINKYSIFKCDSCNRFFDNNQGEKDLWHNCIFGDLCNFCYKKIKNEYFLKKNNNKKFLLQLAKKQIFKNELDKTIRILDQKKLPELNTDKKNLILKNVTTQIMRDRGWSNCGICLDVLENNIYAGTCGHCFHYECISNNIGGKCPMCRKDTNFIKLHL
mgnify:FL=1